MIGRWLLAELAEVIARPKFAQRIQTAGLSAAALVQDYTRFAEMVEPAPLPQPVSRDPDDDVVLATALAARATLIVSGDQDLLVLGFFADIASSTPPTLCACSARKYFVARPGPRFNPL